MPWAEVATPPFDFFLFPQMNAMATLRTVNEELDDLLRSLSLRLIQPHWGVVVQAFARAYISDRELCNRKVPPIPPTAYLKHAIESLPGFCVHNRLQCLLRDPK